MTAGEHLHLIGQETWHGVDMECAVGPGLRPIRAGQLRG